jgi:hypothetical protein
MKRIFLILHALAVFASLSACLLAASDSISYFGQEPWAFTYSRSSVALLCGLFASIHLYLFISKQLTIPVALLFYPLFLALGLATNYVARASAKGWAPSSSSEAAFANVVGYGVITLLVIACASSCYWSISRNRRINA